MSSEQKGDSLAIKSPVPGVQAQRKDRRPMKEALLFVLLLPPGNLYPVRGETVDSSKAAAEKTVAQQRQKIDIIDKQIVSLLNERARIALEIGRIRQREGIPPSSARSREEQVLQNASKLSRAPLSPQAARRIYERILAEMVAMQTLDQNETRVGNP